ncbi:Myc-type, basic helix-loop-helix (bHLH) domain-containing protein [Cynara cardunculus var. scolymus]|uniref:Myc-type, basic helix-loop-helix (BHLH) domain-containing protein n=1 Tax=Cynara cardunculus var. scolymus TaxID=59895 RepID=A0A103YJD0_CYNCS|nr:Myc-type, basic helix-loop-helix (bHLH) domain-containing protein [Cynara cardunculus var. scolymus]
MSGDRCTSLTDFFDSYAGQFEETNFLSPSTASTNDIFSILEVFEGGSDEFTSMMPLETGFHAKDHVHHEHPLVSQKSTSSCSVLQDLVEAELEMLSPKTKRQKLSSVDQGGANSDGQQKVSHITVERNRRKQMNEHLTGDQASIIGGVVDYIAELQQVLQSLEAKKQRKVYSDVLSPRLVSSSPRPSPLSPRKPPISPRPLLPISPRTPQPVSPYKPRFQQPATTNSSYIPPIPSPMAANLTPPSLEPSPSSSSSTSDIVNELVANSKSAIADVEVKFSGPNLLLKTISPRLPGQATKIVSVLEDLSLEILQASINTADETMVQSFTIKVSHRLKNCMHACAQLHVLMCVT